MINSKWVRGGCVLAAFFMAISLFVGAFAVQAVPAAARPSTATATRGLCYRLLE
jgi:hypothetical protein